MSLTGVGDLVLIHLRGEPAGYARVEEITPDVKPGWWQVRLLLLQVPRQEVVWILREAYIDGEEFTMGGDPMNLERLDPPQPKRPAPPQENQDQDQDKSGKVVSLLDRRSNKD